jgi:hypothetical protein
LRKKLPQRVEEEEDADLRRDVQKEIRKLRLDRI